MPEYKIIKLKNLTPFHIGTGKENYDFSSDKLHSDTLSSAIAALRAQKGLTDDLYHFLDSFILSSAFPFQGNNYFLPKQEGRLEVDYEGEEHELRKRLKKVKYINFELWREIVKGSRITIKEEQLRNEFLTVGSNLETISKSFTTQRVSVSRDEDGKTEPFFFEWEFYNADSGLFCIVDCDDSLFPQIVELFEELGVNGLGTDKNVGGGKFDVEVGTITLPEVDNPDSTLLLSLYIPTEDELPALFLDQAKYQLLQRGGFMAGSQQEAFRHLRKQTIYMFAAGSCFPMVQPLKGKIVDLQPQWNDENMHSVYRSGKPFYIPIKMIKHE